MKQIVHFLISNIIQRNKKLIYSKQYRYGSVMVSVLVSCVLDMYVFGSIHDRVKPQTIKLILSHSVRQLMQILIGSVSEKCAQWSNMRVCAL